MSTASIARYVLAFALAIAFLMMGTSATPVPGRELEKRITRVGRVSILLSPTLPLYPTDLILVGYQGTWFNVGKYYKISSVSPQNAE